MVTAAETRTWPWWSDAMFACSWKSMCVKSARLGKEALRLEGRTGLRCRPGWPTNLCLQSAPPAVLETERGDGSWNAGEDPRATGG
jgi:hypothetical protein